MNNFKILGSETAKKGFKNEQDICNKFNNWSVDNDAQKWLVIMGYVLKDIEYVKADVLHGYKSDVNVQIQIKLKNVVDTENIQVKLVSNTKGFNQVDKRWLSHYKEMWNIPEEIYNILQYYTGEKLPFKANTRDKRRMFLTEFSRKQQKLVLDWFTKNKTLILSDIIRGRGQFSAEWILVVQKTCQEVRWVLVNINQALQHYSLGDVVISRFGSLYIGRVTMQRKGGDAGRPTACMLQFKLDPTELFDFDVA